MTNTAEPDREALEEACVAIGLDPRGAQPIRIAENQIWRLTAGVVVRMTPPGRRTSAEREIRIARWLTDHGIPAVVPLDVQQPLEHRGRTVTFWEQAPPHSPGTISDVALTLKELHALPLPGFDIGHLDPFVRIPERLAAAGTLADDDRRWLLDLQRDLSERWAAGLPDGLPLRAIHGDAWPGNIVRVGNGRLLMDLERFSVGPPEWDLVSTAVRTKTTGATSPGEYEEFCAVYGHDVTTWAGYETLAATRELRMTTYAALHAAGHPAWREQAQFRVDCLRGRHGPRPWHWTGIV
ncbi:aminoglycoside phosphotransferase [Embleya scabrispora]|uniref:Aminoglycoside phosphotransferase n=1 Tax=Embleya scabrispora TaxID=159449 RepID=A0A1T3NJB8_9ACTN|nr:aminoglycoside phosphotransferase family protein [Embleya scabrispora]OPC76800.1 aminoglycoside phosphotransferase [Embleya scabrispora]